MIRIEVVYSPGPGQVDAVTLDLPEGATVGAALSACGGPQGWLVRHGLQAATADAGVWGRRQPASHPLRDGDRLEIYRPLRCDPKEARRQRYRKARFL
jgi:putative ubiquitin-RnfH superfamily antitoxin RatB of RatAB toxin-antitoxin module